MIGSEADARKVIRLSLARFVGDMSERERQVVLVNSARIAKEWLPSLGGVEFVRVADDDARAEWFNGCWLVIWITVFREPTTLHVKVARGNACEESSVTYHFDRTRTGWELREPVDAGSSAFVTHCGCR